MCIISLCRLYREIILPTGSMPTGTGIPPSGYTGIGMHTTGRQDNFPPLGIPVSSHRQYAYTAAPDCGRVPRMYGTGFKGSYTVVVPDAGILANGSEYCGSRDNKIDMIK